MVPEGSPALCLSETTVLERIVMAEKPWRGSVHTGNSGLRGQVMPEREGIYIPYPNGVQGGGGKSQCKRMCAGKQDLFLNALQTSSRKLLTMSAL